MQPELLKLPRRVQKSGVRVPRVATLRDRDLTIRHGPWIQTRPKKDVIPCHGRGSSNYFVLRYEDSGPPLPPLCKDVALSTV